MHTSPTGRTNKSNERSSGSVLSLLHALLQELSESEDIYGRLSASIAPEIFGHEDVKRALLLLMVGGVTRHLKDGMKLRGDIHLCLMGQLTFVSQSYCSQHASSFHRLMSLLQQAIMQYALYFCIC